jgi:hypothetical protein
MTEYTPIQYVKFQRMTSAQANYIQTQYKKVAQIRTLAALPGTAEAGEVVYLTADNKFYGYDGSEWGSIGDVELPLLDNQTLLRNAADAAKSARFDLTLLSEGTAKVYYLPDGGGILAVMSEVPIVTGDTEGAVLYFGTSVTDIQSNSNVLIGRESGDSYIEINKEVGNTGDVIKYNESINNPRFKVESSGRTIVKKLTIFNGGDG